MLLSVPVLTLASTLALAFPIENPGINRAAVAFPSIVALAALPAARLIEAARGRPLLPRALAAAGLLGLAAVSVRENWEGYFVRFAAQQRMIAEPTMDLARVMREYRARGVPFDNVYLLNTSSWIDGRMLAFEIGDLLWPVPHDVAPKTPVPFLLDRPLLFFFHPSDADRRAAAPRGLPRRRGAPDHAVVPRSELLHVLRAEAEPVVRRRRPKRSIAA